MPRKPKPARGAQVGVAKGTAAPTGCCTISAPGVPDRDIPGVTQVECTAIANAQPGAVAHWVKGDCA